MNSSGGPFEMSYEPEVVGHEKGWITLILSFQLSPSDIG
jgi:hypothetical protein